MPAPTNIFKQRLQTNQSQIGCWAGTAHPYSTEMLGKAGFDWLLLDWEHAPNNLPTILAQLQVLEASASHPIVRLPTGDKTLIKQVLDIGAQTLLIPMIESVEEARAMVEAVNYPPKGQRGIGAALARASHFNIIKDYLHTANDDICLLLQIETVKGLNALDDILQLDNIDGIFIGPSDLAADMGFIGQTGHEEVRKAVTDTLTRIKKSGKAAGILSLDEAFNQHCIDALNIDFIAVGIDVLEYVNSLQTLANKYIKRNL
ncbi:MAG: HpcH/HpaI aldolase/citrate lyase family protein [Alphaproteobacteria bacterium]|nr:HpcH/HpaI aldolase/citrate lyase family protein [Alphaproteobacteria bacterium]